MSEGHATKEGRRDEALISRASCGGSMQVNTSVDEKAVGDARTDGWLPAA